MTTRSFPDVDALDLSLVGRALARRWRFVALCGAAGALVGIATALVLPSRYRASGSFQPESQMPSMLSGGLASLATQLGAGALGGQANPQFYADLLQSRALLLRLAGESFPSPAGVRPLWQLYGYRGLDENERTQRAADRLARKLEVGNNFRTGVVSFSVEGSSPAMAKALADSVLAAVNDFNVRVRQSRAANERRFTAARAEEARQALSSAENSLAEFNQRNRVVTSPGLQLEYERLRRAVDMNTQVYVQLRLQAENAAAQEVRDTPALSVIDAPVLPIKRSWPNRRLTVLASLLAGVLLSAAYTVLLALRPLERHDEQAAPRSERPRIA